ncbi:glycosyltransferase family 2 protein [Patescibacteria group bacterium]|nr:glycosyltransferase family 2 protein [Patescibacteria group bacterium]
MTEDYYLKISRASDLKSRKERLLYRLLEIFPGMLSWGTLILVIFFSWKFPAIIAIFIIFFVLYWFFRTIYLSFHLRAGYQRMRQHEKADWLKKLNQLQNKRRQEIRHLIVLPMYREPLEIVRNSFLSLVKSDYPKENMIVVLACEEKARDYSLPIAEAIKKEFGSKFFKFLITWHPQNIPGEIPGKGSNETFAVMKVKKETIDPLKIPYQNIIFSSFDIDTVVFPKYFSCLTYYYLTSINPTRTSYQPIPLFINNIWEASAFSRVFAFSATFWHTMNQERPEKLITFSSHSMSFKALVDVGFKLPNVVSDDSRIFWQCFLKYNGDYRVEPIYYPVSMDANCAKTFFKTLINIYKQQRRWAYGIADIPYFLFGFLKNRKIPLSRKLLLGFELIEGHWSWATASFLIFFLGWLPLILGGPEFTQTLFSYNLPRIISLVLTLSMIGLISSAYLSLLLLPPRPPKYRRHKYPILFLQWFLLPLMMIFFTALPALEAQTRLMLGKYMGFWPTEKFRKQ